MPNTLEKLNQKDFRLMALCAGIAAVSLWIVIKLFFQVFPEASIQFDVNRESSRHVAQEFLSQLNLARSSQAKEASKISNASLPATAVLADLDSYRHAAIFTYDETAKTFLERELGLEKANRIMGREVRLWRWRHRWFRPLQKEEFQVDVSTLGEITRLQHLVEEKAPGADLTREEAQSLAEAFLQNTLHRDLSTLEFIEVTTEKRERRTDHLFRWKSKEFAVGDAQYRFSVRIQGSEVGEYDENLKVPDEWLRGYQKLRSLNETTATVAFIFLFLTIVAMLVVLVLHVRQRDIHWRLASYFGLTAFLLTLLSQLNSFPLDEFRYSTTDSYGSFLTQLLLNAVLAAAASGAAIFLITACAEPLYRQNYGTRVSLSNLFRWRGLRSKEFFIGTLVGLTLTFFFFAYDSVFYLIAQKLGAWAPAEVPYSDLLNTKIPWAFVLFFGFFPAVSEEFISRMFSIPFFEKVFRYRWLAVLIASFIWGFGHANYPNQPFYIRGIEVGVGGLIVSFVFLKFGIVGPLVWHYSVDALFTAFLLLRSQNRYLMISGGLSAGIMLIPFFIALVAYLRNKGFLATEPISNASENLVEVATETPREAATELTSVAYVPLSRKHRLILVGASLVFLVPQIFKVERFGEFVDIAITRSQARKIAQRFLENQGVHWQSFNNTVYINQSLDFIAGQYLLKHSDVSVLNQIYSEKVKVYFWVVRFYKPLEEEEYRIYIDPREKSVITFEHVMSENAPGASLDRASALQLAEKFLLEKGVSLNQYDLKEADSEKKKARQDHVFVWESKVDRIREAALRLRLHLKGDQVSSYSAYIKVPEEWRREREKTTVAHTLLLGIRLGVIAFLSGWGIWTLLRKARQRLIRWTPILSLSVGLVILQFLSSLNALPGLFQDYRTSLAPQIFVVTSMSTLLISQIFQFLYFVLLLGLASSLYPECWRIFRKENRARLSQATLLITLFVLIAAFGLTAISAFLTQRFHQVALLPRLAVAEEVNHFLPAFSPLSRALRSSLVYASILAILLYFLRGVLKQTYSRLLFLLLILFSLLPDRANTLGEFVFALATHSVILMTTASFVLFFLRLNFPAYLSVFFFVSLFRSAYELSSQSSSFFKWNGAALFGLGIAVLFKLGYDAVRYSARQRNEKVSAAT